MAWGNAKRRCSNPGRHNFHRYGGRGITMCSEWMHDFGAFIAHIGPKPSGKTLERIDNNKGYEPGNVRWASPAEQAINRRQGAQDSRVIPDAIVAEIKRTYVPNSRTFGSRALGRKYGCCYKSILYAINHF